MRFYIYIYIYINNNNNLIWWDEMTLYMAELRWLIVENNGYAYYNNGYVYYNTVKTSLLVTAFLIEVG